MHTGIEKTPYKQRTTSIHASCDWLVTSYLRGMLPTLRDDRGSATDRQGFVISSNTDGAMYVNPFNNKFRHWFDDCFTG